MWRAPLLMVLFGIVGMIPTLAVSYLFHLWDWSPYAGVIPAFIFGLIAVFLAVKVGERWEDWHNSK